jgi:hypothetical protein
LHGQTKRAEDYYISAFNEISDMLESPDSMSIKRATYLSEWAYYEGRLNYMEDFCYEIDRIANFITAFYLVNRLDLYKTGKQMAINEFFFKPYSGNGYKPFTYNFEDFSIFHENWECQFVSKALKTHVGQCRSLPWLYKIIAKEIGASVSIAQAPGHCYITYRDEDNLTPENWINLELTTHQMQPSLWIKKDFDICDSAIIVGTYMTPLTDVQTIACQMADLAFGYCEKFNRYDEFTFCCASRSLEFYSMNPNAWIIRGKSLEQLIHNHLIANGGILDEYAKYLVSLMDETKRGFNKTHMTEISEKFLEQRLKRTIEAQQYTKEKLLTK